ncbi:MAG: ABC transporter ATP-binding protein [Halanaerobiaceae bacterium]|nr:ABC transporter ATP-binding protein [Halanaerobiaceae bacterium]
MIQIKGVTKIYDGGKKAVDNLNMEIKKGEIFGFLGPNGAGKTTTLRMITGILAPTGGEIYVNGYNISTEALEAKRSFTYVPDHPDIFNAISGIDYLNFIADIYEVPLQKRKEKIEKYTKDFEIYDALTKLVSSYSHGMKQKLLISAALLPEPAVFILDEPLSGLDPKSSRILKEIMKEHSKKGGTVLFSSHILEVVENLCDRIGIIKDGVLVACDSLENLKKHSDSSLEDIFMELTENE